MAGREQKPEEEERGFRTPFGKREEGAGGWSVVSGRLTVDGCDAVWVGYLEGVDPNHPLLRLDNNVDGRRRAGASPIAGPTPAVPQQSAAPLLLLLLLLGALRRAVKMRWIKALWGWVPPLFSFLFSLQPPEKDCAMTYVYIKVRQKKQSPARPRCGDKAGAVP